MIKTYVEAPKTVEGIRLLTRQDFEDALAWMRDDGAQCSSVVLQDSLIHQSYIMIHQVTRPMIHANWGEWILRDGPGVFRVADPAAFDRLYVSAEAIG